MTRDEVPVAVGDMAHPRPVVGEGAPAPDPVKRLYRECCGRPVGVWCACTKFRPAPKEAGRR